MKNIEVEVRSFIAEEKYQKLLDYFKEEANLVKEDYQETFYFDSEEDLRIQKNSFGAKIWMKKGKLHDDHREEIEIRVGEEDFPRLEELFTALGYGVEIKWFRKRYQFDWEGIKVCLDHTRGYGYIIELEKMSGEEEKEEVYAELQEKLVALDLSLTPKEEFEKKFTEYKENRQELTGEK